MLRTFFFLIVLCLTPAVGTNATAEAPAGPKVYLPENVFVFEPVPDGVEVVHDFIVTNQGDQPLEIGSIKSG
jgi:hypothetical protein